MSDDEKRDGGVLSGLPRTRPQRRSGRRAASAPAGEEKPKKPATSDARKTATTKATAKRATAASKKKPAARKAAAKKPAAAKPPAAKRTPAVKAAPKPAPTRARRRPAPLDQPRQPPGSPPPPDPATEERRRERGHAGVLGTAAQAAGELGSIGVTIGRQLVKGAIDRLPKP